MFCEKCGAQIEDGSKFCDKCGAKVEAEAAPVQETPVQEAPAQAEAPAQEGAQAAGQAAQKAAAAAEQGKKAAKEGLSKLVTTFKGLPKKTQGIVGGVAALIVILFIVLVSGGNKVKLDKYVTISASGYNGIGHATYEFDRDAFLKDYGKKLKLKGKYKKQAQEAMGDIMSEFGGDNWQAELFLEFAADGSLDQKDNLSNGDVVTFTWNFDGDDEDIQEIQKAYGVKLKYKDITYKVSGLEEVDTFDAFKDIELVYTGVAPNGQVSIQNNSTDAVASELYYEVTPSSGLSNGDKVEVKINYNVDSMAEEYGKVPDAESKEYTVDGLGSYITKIADIPEDTLNKMKAQMEDQLNENYAKRTDNTDPVITKEAVSYIGSYMLVPKDMTGYNPRISTVMVYKIRTHMYCEEHGVDTTFDYYWYGTYQNLILLPDGTCSVKLTDYNTVYDSFRKTVTEPGWFSDTTDFSFSGYEDLDSLFNDVVTTNIASYTYDSTVEDVDLGTDEETEDAENTDDSAEEEAAEE